MAVVLRLCIVCGNEMQTRRNTKTMCSVSCRQKLYKQRNSKEVDHARADQS